MSGGDALPDAFATAFIPGTDLDILLEHAVKVFLPGVRTFVTTPTERVA